MAVLDLAREKVVTVEPNNSIDDVVTTMTDMGVGSVIVVDGDEPVGIVTDRDVVVRVYGADADPGATTAGDIMSEDLVTIEGDAGVYDLVKTMADHGVRRMPVVEDGDLAGIITLDDVLILLGMELSHMANTIRSESPPFEVPARELVDD